MIHVNHLPSSTHHKTNTNKPISSVITAEVEFGRPNRGCDGVGICKITVEPAVADHQGKKCKRFKGEFYQRENTLIIRFRRSSLCPGLFRTQFRRDYFLIEEPVDIPAAMQRQLGNLPAKIRPGRYLIWITEEELEILINL